MHVTIVGTGYVGLVTGCCLAEVGHSVVCVDNNRAKVATMQAGNVPIFEPGLDELMVRNIQAGRLSFTTKLAAGVAGAEAIFLALPTPPLADGSADLSAVLAVAQELGACLPKNYSVIFDKSTVPVGTADLVHKALSTHAVSEYDVVSNPEFLREGYALEDFMKPDRIVVGLTDQRAEKIVRQLYEPFTRHGYKLYVTDPATAELTKYAANTFLLTKISFMNEIARLCELLGADIDMLQQTVGSDSRIGNRFLSPGIGAGGSCFPKDVRALRNIADKHNYDFKLIKATMAVNDRQFHLLVEKIQKHFGNKLKGKTFALWGLAFKPNTDDIREAPALTVINELLAAGAKVVAYDPEAAANVRELYMGEVNLNIVEDKYDALPGATALLIATEWPEFIDADLPRVKQDLEEPVIFDGRNIFTPAVMSKSGFTYYSIGRRPVLH